jgi:cell division protein DivIC
MKKFSSIITNKYLLAIAFFLVWMTFFDQKDFFNTLQTKKEFNALQEKKKYYVGEIVKARQELSDFQNNSAAIEKFARQRYFLKRDGEDVFIIEDSLETKKSITQ